MANDVCFDNGSILEIGLGVCHQDVFLHVPDYQNSEVSFAYGREVDYEIEFYQMVTI